MTVSLDASGLKTLAADLDRAGRTAPRRAAEVVEVGARHVRDFAREAATGIGHAPHYPRSITHDLTLRGFAAEAEVGPDKTRTQGALGNILEFGTSKNAPIPHLGPALAREAPAFLRAMRDLGDVL